MYNVVEKMRIWKDLWEERQWDHERKDKSEIMM
jgi:hypothetical protein